MNGNDETPVAGSGIFGLGFGGPADPYLREKHINELDSQWSELQRQFEQTKQTIGERLDAQLAELRLPLTECTDCVQGGLDAKLDNLKAMRDGVVQAIEQRLDNKLGILAGQLVSIFQELEPSQPESAIDRGPIEAPDVRTLIRPGEQPIEFVKPPDDYPSQFNPVGAQPNIAGGDIQPIQWPGGTPGSIPFTGGGGLGGITGDVTFNPPGGVGGGNGGGGGGGFIETPRDSIGIGGGIPSVPFCEAGVGHYELRDGIYQCIYPDGPGGGGVGGGSGGGGGGGNDTIGGGGGGGGDTCGPGGCGADTVPSTCTLPSGAKWVNENDHTQGYHVITGPFTNKFVATPECVEKKTCPQCSPDKWVQPGDESATIAAGELFSIPCDPANEGVFESQGNEQEQVDKLVNGMQASQRKSFQKVYDDAKGVSFIGKAILWAFGSIQSSIAFLAGEQSAFAADGLPTPSGCDTVVYKSAVRMAALLSGMEKLLVFVPEHLKANLQQKMNYACQFITPSPPNLDLMRLRKCITENEWRFGMKIQGVCLDWAELNYKAATEYVESPQDLIRFMMRDVFDPDVVEGLGLSEDFDSKWTEEAQRIGEKIGLKRETALRFWQAHWNMLSPGQLYEMMHRLAPDQDATDPNGDPVSMTPAEVEKWLKVADLPPALIKNLMAISYKPLAKRDARFLWATEAIDDEGLTKLFRQQGFSPENSEILTQGAVKAWANDRAKYTGAPTLAELNKLYKEDALSFDDYVANLTESNLVPGDVDGYANSQRFLKEAADRKMVVGKLRTAFIQGRFDNAGYLDELSKAGVPDDRANAIFLRDEQIKRASNKQITIAKLCTLVGQGYLTMDEYIRRAVNLGFNSMDAALMAQSCNDDLVKRRNAEIQREQRKALQEAEKAARKAKAAEAEQRRKMREKYPCKPKSKPTCPADAPLPEYMTES